MTPDEQQRLQEIARQHDDALKRLAQREEMAFEAMQTEWIAEAERKARAQAFREAQKWHEDEASRYGDDMLTSKFEHTRSAARFKATGKGNDT